MKRYLLAACVVLVLAAAMAGILRATTRRAGGTPDPAGFALHFPDRLVTILGDDQGYDARLIRVDDERGRPVVVQASVNRLNWRMTWVNPAYGSNPEVAPRSSSAFQRPVSVV